jgi:hypothetical protein
MSVILPKIGLAQLRCDVMLVRNKCAREVSSLRDRWSISPRKANEPGNYARGIRL